VHPNIKLGPVSRPQNIFNFAQLEAELQREAELTCRLEDLRQSVTAGHRARRLDAGKGASTIHRINVVVAVHHSSPINLWVTAESRWPGRAYQPGRDRELVEAHSSTLIEN